MDINTKAIRRLRDHLLAVEEHAPGTAAEAEQSQTRDAVGQAILRRVEPFAETMFLVMMADGVSATVERKALAAALAVLTDDRINLSEINVMLDRFAVNVATVGGQVRLGQIGARLCMHQEDRETAFTLAAVVAMADDRVDVKESQILQELSEVYGISSKRLGILLEALD